MKKIFVVILIIIAFILGMVVSEILLSGINDLFDREIFNTRQAVEKKLDEQINLEKELQVELNKKEDALKNLINEMRDKDYTSLTKENLLTDSGTTEMGKVRVKSALNEIYFKPDGGEDDGVNRVREEFNKNIKTMLDISSNILRDKVQNLNLELLAVNNKLVEKNMVLTKSLLELEQYREQLAKNEEYISKLRDIQSDLQSRLGELTTKIEDGKLRVDFKGDILFASGRHALTEKGKEILSSIAQVLVENTANNDIFIAGHTDNVPIRTGSRDKYASNWELSTFRAVEVVKFLTGRGIDPRKITAAGYGKFKPVTDNESKEGKAKNRRVELFLIPRIIKR
jgi:chemotaxis protein MotB